MPKITMQDALKDRLNGLLSAFSKDSPIVENLNSPASKMMLALTKKAERHGPGTIYEGTVPRHVTAKRRARNKMARQSRAANRR